MQNVIIKKTLPFHFEAEQAILGIIFLYPQKMHFIYDVLYVEDFFEIKHRNIFKVMKDLFKEKKDIDYISVHSLLKDKNISKDKEEDIDYLIDLVNLISDIKNLETYIELIKEAALKRELIEVSASINAKGYSDKINAQDYLDLAETEIFKFSQKRKTNFFIEIGTLLKSIQEKTINNRNSDKQVIGLRTGFNSLDKITLGFKPEEFIVLASRPAMGKSAFVMNLALNMSRVNITPPVIAIFSLEMSNEQIGTRMLSFKTKIYHKKIILSKGLSEHELNMIQKTCDEISEYNIFFDDSSSLNISTIRSQCRRLKYENKLDFVIIDYLQLIHDSDQKNNRQTEISNISRNLKQMARELKIPVFALSQLSRDVEKREDKKPILSDLRDSGSIEQDADVVMFLYRDDYYVKDKNQFGKNDVVKVDLIISKNRHGIIGIKKFDFNLTNLSFIEEI
ncbi:Replicative DNA helicase [Candidatus Phytoplasma mali]|uniref:Replicative DNA helicase n=1 Tax=Phytoplasma mali (strain AT) TaxID=482235 RepID=B3R0J9_PHYMT|nr:replicative DNA helicase [Candidatus Phytoplasma mali]CAP18363.1 Replicative DNA helicase [Candidatus Phytoplasma mali]